MKSVDAAVLLAGMLVPQAGAATASRTSPTRISRGTKPWGGLKPGGIHAVANIWIQPGDFRA
jgi:hypothetical protein